MMGMFEPSRDAYLFARNVNRSCASREPFVRDIPESRAETTFAWLVICSGFVRPALQ